MSPRLDIVEGITHLGPTLVCMDLDVKFNLTIYVCHGLYASAYIIHVNLTRSGENMWANTLILVEPAIRPMNMRDTVLSRIVRLHDN